MMTPELEEIGKTLVEAEGGCWHEFGNNMISWESTAWCKRCTHVHSLKDNPDFSKWENFGRLLYVMDEMEMTKELQEIIELWRYESYQVDRIPLLVATELARIIKENNTGVCAKGAQPENEA